jgi:hypothetical protein
VFVCVSVSVRVCVRVCVLRECALAPGPCTTQCEKVCACAHAHAQCNRRSCARVPSPRALAQRNARKLVLALTPTPNAVDDHAPVCPCPRPLHNAMRESLCLRSRPRPMQPLIICPCSLVLALAHCIACQFLKIELNTFLFALFCA